MPLFVIFYYENDAVGSIRLFNLQVYETRKKTPLESKL